MPERRNRFLLKQEVYATLLLLLLLTWLSPTESQAGPFRMTGFDTPAIASGNSLVADGQGLGVLYSNPALLSRSPSQIELHFIVLGQFMDIGVLDKPVNANVPYSIYDSDVGRVEGDVDRALPTSELPAQRRDNRVEAAQGYLSLGFSHSLTLKGFRLGLLFILPADYFASINTWYHDEREQYFTNQLHFMRFGEWSEIVSGFVGASYAPTDWISIGISLQVRLAAAIDLNIYVPNATVQNYALFNINLDARAVLRPIVGIQAIPWKHLSLGLTYRHESMIDVDDLGSLYFWNYHLTAAQGVDDKTMLNQILQKYRVIIDYEPMELAGGIGMNYEEFAARLVVTWNRWANFIDMHGQRPEEAAEYPLLDLSDPKPKGEKYKFKDTVSVNLGLEYRYLDWAKAELGFGYYPSPTPPQTGRTNYVDGHTFMAALGHRFDFTIEGAQFHAELGLQLWRMFESTTYKDPAEVRDEFPDTAQSLFTEAGMSEAQGLQTNNPGFPGYSQSGWVLVASGSFNYHF